MNQEKKFYLSKEGLKAKKIEYENLKKIRNSKTSGEAPVLLESEDLNPDFISFQEDLGRLDSLIAELENVLKNAVIIEKTRKGKDEIITVGSKFLVEIDGEAEDEFTIVGTLEAKPILGRISDESPVGKALLGHKIGDLIVLSSPIKTSYKIKKILS